MNEIVILESQAEKTMSSREIAELTGKQHKDVLRDIRVMLEQLGTDANLRSTDTKGCSIVKYQPGKCAVANVGKTKEILLDRRHSEILVTGYDVVRRAKVIDRWMELELKGRKVFDPAMISKTDLCRMVIESEQQRIESESEAKRLNHVANTTAKQFVSGMTPSAFCHQLNGVNVKQVVNYLVSEGWLIRDNGVRASAKCRDDYFKTKPKAINEVIRYSVVLTERGAIWLYSKYLKGDLPMKKTWDGEFTHSVFKAA